MNLAAGRFDRKLTIERASESTNPYGEVVQSWSVLATVWCERRDMSDRESLALGEVAAEITTRFTIRYSSLVAGMTPKDRLLFEGRVYDIRGVREIGRRELIEISAEARRE